MHIEPVDLRLVQVGRDDPFIEVIEHDVADGTPK
jgi:hypothetical protein